MREAETEDHEGKRKVEALWPIFKIHHQKSRYLFDLFYRRKAISRELYDYCIKEKIADANLIAKWKKQGYENLCCLRCIRLETPTSRPTASAVCPRTSWRRAGLWSASTVAAEVALDRQGGGCSDFLSLQLCVQTS